MRAARLALFVVAIGTTGLTATGQEPPATSEPPAAPDTRADTVPPIKAPAREPITPEKAKAAWALEATGVARRVGAREDQIASVVKAYSEAREAQLKGLRKHQDTTIKEAVTARDAGDGRSKGDIFDRSISLLMKGINDIQISDRENLQRELAGTLSADQTTRAMASLGTFDIDWDAMADAVADLDLGAIKQQEALNTIEDFVISDSKLFPILSGGSDYATMEAASKESRRVSKRLDEAMKAMLTDEQFARFKAGRQAVKGDRWIADE